MIDISPTDLLVSVVPGSKAGRGCLGVTALLLPVRLTFGAAFFHAGAWPAFVRVVGGGHGTAP